MAVLIGFTAVFALFFRLVIMWLYNGSGGSLLIVALFHSALNVVSGQQLTPEFVPFSDASSDNLLVIGVLAVAAVVITFATRGRLARPIKEH